jgi:SagB-type dehydrogenase family enzyme
MAPGDGRVEVRGPFGGLALAVATPGVAAALSTLAQQGAGEDALADAVRTSDGNGALPVLHYCLERLDVVGALSRTLLVNGRPVATVEPIAARQRYATHGLRHDRRYALSRFASVRRESTRLVLESPLARARVVLHDGRGPAVLAGLAEGAAPAELSAGAPGLGEVLFGAAMLTEVDPDGGTAEDADPALVLWEAQDLAFHSRSRRGRHDGGYGGTYRLAGAVEPLPAVKPPPPGPGVDLYRPELEHLSVADSTLTSAIQERRSVRTYGSEALTAKQLGEFLGRAAALRRVEETAHGELAFYAYPSGGASSEITLYVAIDRCRGLEPGLHMYAPGAHRLHPVCGRTAETELLLREAAAAMTVTSNPQALVVLAARFGRVSWKYERMAYALILKHVGVLYQQMYLVATAMGLGACAIGGGDSDLFTAAAGTSYYEESSVGELALGTLP